VHLVIIVDMKSSMVLEANGALKAVLCQKNSSVKVGKLIQMTSESFVITLCAQLESQKTTSFRPNRQDNFHKHIFICTMFKCEICGKEFEKGQSLGAHKNSKHNPEAKKKMHTKTTSLIEVKKICPKCGKSFLVKRSLRKDGTIHSFGKENTYDSRICANGRPHTNDWNKKISTGVSRENSKKPPKKEYHCVVCSKKLSRKTKTGKCFQHCKENPNEIERYRQQCSFKFNVFDYPNEFDLELVQQRGFYSAKNRGNNLEGISRDHMFSVKDGLKNRIPPDVIAHPANCRLIPHRENMSKNSKSILRIDQLYERIEGWNAKYGPMARVALDP
jgi:C2H2-type zinc finger